MAWRPNIYYTAAITTQSEECKRRACLSIKVMQEYGHVLTEHIGYTELVAWELKNMLNGVNIANRDLAWLAQSDALVADITHATTGGGLETAINLGQLLHPTLTLREQLHGSKMIYMLQHPQHDTRTYEHDAELEAHLRTFCSSLVPTNKTHARLILYDAIDGAGKGALTQAYQEWARKNNVAIFDAREYSLAHDKNPTWDDALRAVPECQAVFASEPTFAELGKFIRNVLIKKGSTHPPDAVAHAYSMDRYPLFIQLVLPALSAGAWVFMDRGAITSDVYQPVQANMLWNYSQEYFQCLVRGLPGNRLEFDNTPGLLVIPQVPAEVAQARLDARSDKSDNVVFENLSFQQRTAKIYRSEALREFYERRGTRVVHLEVSRSESREITVHRAHDVLVDYVRGNNLL